MPRFRVMLRADSAEILLEGKPTILGFFTTRAVDASTPEDAVTAASNAVRRDSRLKLTSDPTSLTLHVEELTSESWWWQRWLPTPGFVFFAPEDNGDSAQGRSDKQPSTKAASSPNR